MSNFNRLSRNICIYITSGIGEIRVVFVYFHANMSKRKPLQCFSSQFLLLLRYFYYMTTIFGVRLVVSQVLTDFRYFDRFTVHVRVSTV